jgi:hypothetical protein
MPISHQKTHTKPLHKELLEFYFKPMWRTILTVIYLLFFGYFLVFYIDNLWLIARFILYTLNESTLPLSLSSLFWGAVFIIALIIPFGVSLYAIFVPIEVKKKSWDRTRKVLVILMVALVTVDCVVVMDQLIRFIENQGPIKVFLETERILAKN